MDEDLYELLEVSPRASGEVIQAAYRRLARTYHPDGEAPDPDKMVRLNRAFEVLGDPEARSSYDAGRGHPVAQVTPPPQPSRTAVPIPPVQTVDEAPRLRGWAALWVLAGAALVLVVSAVTLGFVRGADDEGAGEPPEARGASAPIDLPVPAGASPRPTSAATTAPAARTVLDLGAVASDIPGTPLPLGNAVRSVVDQNTKPRDVYALTLGAGQEVRFVLDELASPITAWLDISVVNPGARDLNDSRSFTLALTRSTYAQGEWKFTPAVAGTYYLVVKARTSAQAYSFTLTAAR